MLKNLVIAWSLAGLLAGCGYPQSLYFVAATKTDGGTEGYPSSLYTRGFGKTLRLLRVVSPSSYYVQECDGEVISILYPPTVPTHVSVVHMADPTRADDIAVNSESRFDVFDSLELANKGGAVQQLLGLTKGPEVGSRMDLEKVELSLTSVASRVSAGSPQDYIHLFTMGMAGGPTNDFMLFGYREGKSLLPRTGRFGPKGVPIDTLPESFRIPENKEDIGILAANPSYLILGNYYIQQDSKSKDNVTHLFIHDRTKGAWKELQIPGGTSRMRMFGPWLAVIQQWPRHAPGTQGPPWDPLHLYPDPGRAQERGIGSANLPDVRLAYSSGVARDSKIPGVLELDNIQDGRRITLKTNQEDSEILLVTAAGVVLYRVNDTIFEAHIQGSALVHRTTIAKDTDVPEVHWAFLGPTTPANAAEDRPRFSRFKSQRAPSADPRPLGTISTWL
jgi:hypothetical protein